MKADDAFHYVAGIPPDEPVFVLRGQDILAPDTIDHWAELAVKADVSPSAKIREARAVAEEMRNWSPRKLPD